MLLYLSFLAGLACKLYDDLSDNILLKEFKNETFMEFLKGIHYISFTTISINEPLFFIVNYALNFLHSITNREAYKNPYEHSLFYSFLLLFFIIKYKKITTINIIDLLLLISFLFLCFFEPLFISVFLKNKEVSKYKLYLRTCSLIYVFICLLFSNSETLTYVLTYICAYIALSSIIQYYSLFIIDKKGNKRCKKHNKNHNKKHNKKR